MHLLILGLCFVEGEQGVYFAFDTDFRNFNIVVLELMIIITF